MTVLQERELAGPGLPVVQLFVRDHDLRRPGWLQAQLEDVLRVRPDRVEVDLSACPSLDSASLRTLLDIHCELRRQGGQLVLRGLSSRIERVIGVAGLAGVFDVEPAAGSPQVVLPA